NAVLCHANRNARRERHHDDRRSRHRREASSSAARVYGRTGCSMRLLHQRNDHDREGAPRSQSETVRSRRTRPTRCQSLPLWHPRTDHPCSAQGYRTGGEDVSMNLMSPTRREFTAGLGSIIVSFSLDSKLALAQQAAKLPGSLAENRMLDAWIRIN